MSVVRWKFKDLSTLGEYTLAINPNQGGSPGIEKNVGSVHPLAPNRRAIMYEGSGFPSDLTFSGVILTKDHFEALESWAMKRTLIQITDDLGRVFQGVFKSFSPSRDRRAYNYWYHTYSATFALTGMKNVSGTVVYGQIVTSV